MSSFTTDWAKILSLLHFSLWCVNCSREVAFREDVVALWCKSGKSEAVPAAELLCSQNTQGMKVLRKKIQAKGDFLLLSLGCKYVIQKCHICLMCGSGNAYSNTALHFNSCWSTTNTCICTRSFPSALSDSIKWEIFITWHVVYFSEWCSSSCYKRHNLKQGEVLEWTANISVNKLKALHQLTVYTSNRGHGIKMPLNIKVVITYCSKYKAIMYPVMAFCFPALRIGCHSIVNQLYEQISHGVWEVSDPSLWGEGERCKKSWWPWADWKGMIWRDSGFVTVFLPIVLKVCNFFIAFSVQKEQGIFVPSTTLFAAELIKSCS